MKTFNYKNIVSPEGNFFIDEDCEEDYYDYSQQTDTVLSKLSKMMWWYGDDDDDKSQERLKIMNSYRASIIIL